MTRSGNTGRRRASWHAAIGAISVLALVATACGDDDDSGSSATTARSGHDRGGGGDDRRGRRRPPGAATTAGGGTETTTAGGGAAPSGEPIKVMTNAPVNSQLPPYPNIPAAAEVYEQYINDNGGINGRPLQVIVCDDQADADEAANCARKAVEEKVVAIVGSFTVRRQPDHPDPRGDQDPLVRRAAARSWRRSSPARSRSRWARCSPAWAPAAAIKMIDDGCKHVVQVYVDLPAGDVALPAFDERLEVDGAGPDGLKVVKIPLAPQRLQRPGRPRPSSGTDCLSGNISEVNWPALTAGDGGVGCHASASTARRATSTPSRRAVPGADRGRHRHRTSTRTSPPTMWKDYRDVAGEVQGAGPRLEQPRRPRHVDGLTAFTNIVEGMTGEINNETFLDAANKTSKLDTGGMVGALDLTKEYTGWRRGLPADLQPHGLLRRDQGRQARPPSTTRPTT